MIRASRVTLAAPGLAVVLASLVLAGTAHGQDRSLSRLDGYIENAMREWDTPGLSIAIVRNDSVIYSRGYGVRELGKPDRVDERTLFAIGSQTKAFTGLAMSMLADQEAIDRDDPVAKHLTGFRLADPCLTTEISVRDLVTHRSGLPGNNLIFWGTNLSRKQIVDRLRFLQPTAGLRTRYQYQNLMFIAAGEIIPAVTGSTWDEFVRARIFNPLGMASSETSVAALLRSGGIGARSSGPASLPWPVSGGSPSESAAPGPRASWRDMSARTSTACTATPPSRSTTEPLPWRSSASRRRSSTGITTRFEWSARGP